MRTRPVLGLTGLVCLGLTTAARAADYAGKYTSPTLAADLSATGPDAYTGTFRLGDRAYPCKATASAAGLSGTFTSGTNDFPFTATLAGDTLTVATGTTTYTVTRPATVVANPLDARPPANPLEVGKAVGTAAAADVPTVLAGTATGRTLFFQRPTAATAADAIGQTMPIVARTVGGTVKVAKAFADQKSPANGGAAFTATDAAGHAVTGTVLTGGAADGHGTVVTVMYDRADAPAADWATLRAALPQPPVKVTTYTFPDGTGSIDLPAGWKTKQQTLDNGCYVEGPDGQMVAIGQGLAVQDPNGQLVQMMRQNDANSRRMGMRPIPHPPMLIASFSGPQEALKALVPQISEMAQKNGGQAISLDQFLEVKDLPATLPNGKAQSVLYTWTKGTVPYKSMCQSETAEIGMGGWIVVFTEVAAPAAHFDRDGPTMLAIVNSVKLNEQVMRQHQQARNQAAQQMNDQMRADQDQRFQQQQEAHKQQMAGYDRQNQAWANRELAQSRSNADFCEVIRGYRTVEDTQTGTRGTADLGDVDHVVDKLNEGDPGRYKQVPLRDEMYPAK